MFCDFSWRHFRIAAKEKEAPASAPEPVEVEVEKNKKRHLNVVFIGHVGGLNFPK